MLLLIMILTQAEARVFCHDSHAQPWEPLGYACPISCANVITAMKKLKTQDYGELLFKYQVMDKTNEKSQNHDDTNIYTKYKNITNEKQDKTYGNMRKNMLSKAEIKLYERYYKILNNENVVRDLKAEYKAAIASLKECYAQNEVKYTFLKKFNKMCTRRFNIESDFLDKFTSVLNRYTNTIPFTKELTAMVLEKILGKNLDLRHGLFDVNEILVYLSTAIRYHETTSETNNGLVIHLGSKHCMYLKVPGCFCIAGFVEKSGKCVKPSDCFEGLLEKGMLNRIIIH